MNLKYRFAQLSDAAWLAEWNHQLIRDEGHRNPMTIPKLEMRMRRWLGGEYQAMIFEQDDRVVAYALYRPGENAIHLRHFFVHRQHRNKGIGQEAMRILLTGIWPKDRRVVVEALVQNFSAREFWKTIGFKEYSIALEILPADRS
jgi:ribosomal protein S18 acetylase RimI-like enzyme